MPYQLEKISGGALAGFISLSALGIGISIAEEPMTTGISNRLAQEKSPYLKSAAHQPVQWYAWSDEAFKKARELDRPVLLDIGAVWCHWCHVIDRESYENSEIAKLINDYFVPIKVDRDERPDIDSRYQLAVSAISGQGGWPLTAFLTPDGNVFYGGTYFPPEDRYGRPGFKTLLKRVSDIYRSKKDSIYEDARRLHEALKESAASVKPGEILSAEMVDHVLQSMRDAFDPTHGGFGTAPKFPHASAVELAINRSFLGGDPVYTEIVTKTLRAMAEGGVYDQIGRGFHRYSTDERWMVPHFEKMIYDNSELLKNYVHAYQLTQDPFFKKIALEIMEFMNRVLSDQERGGFYASQDADVSLEDDGDYFTWTRKEAEAVLSPEEAGVACLYYDIAGAGEMHHNPEKNVLFVAKSIAALAQETGLTEEAVQKTIETLRAKLLEARDRRPTPFVDRTLYTNWNGLMIQAYLEAYKGLGDAKARAFALKTLDFFTGEMLSPSQGFYHAYSEREARLEGFLDDQIQMALALLLAYEVSGEGRYFDLAKKTTDRCLARFWDEKSGGFFDIEEPHQPVGKLAIRQKSMQDSPSPSSNGTAVLVLDRLSILTGDPAYREKAEATLKAFASQIGQFGFFSGTYALALDSHLRGPLKVVIVSENREAADALKQVALSAFHPYKIIQTVTSRKAGSAPPTVEPAIRALLETQTDFKKAKAFVCQGTVCQPPASDPETLRQLIEKPIP